MSDDSRVLDTERGMWHPKKSGTAIAHIRQNRGGAICHRDWSDNSCFVNFNIFSGSEIVTTVTVSHPRSSTQTQTNRSCTSTATAPRRWTTRMPELTRPKMVCLLSKYGVGPSVKKNCEPVKDITEFSCSRGRLWDSTCHSCSVPNLPSRVYLHL